MGLFFYVRWCHASGNTNHEQYLINNINKIFPTVFETIQQLFESEVNV